MAQFAQCVDHFLDMDGLLHRVFTFPKPVVAAINGHTFGDGTILACACDFRLMKADKGYFCLPEVDINIPLLPAMQAIVKKAMPYYKFVEIVLTGKRATAPELAESHVLVKACENQEALMRETLAFAQTFTKQRPIFSELKKRMNKHIIEIMECEDPEFINTGQLLKM